eukprot:876651-Rhodomonas_salina.1
MAEKGQRDRVPKKRAGFFTFMPKRTLLGCRADTRPYSLPWENEPSLGCWLALEQLERGGTAHDTKVAQLKDWAAPWRPGWHPPMLPLAALHP